MMNVFTDGRIESFHGAYRYLSNFWGCRVVVQGVEFANAEQAYQWHKATTEQDRASILAERNPGRVKRKGRAIRLRPDWELAGGRVKRNVMIRVVFAKFNQNPDLRAELLATDSAELIEGNRHHDNTWGTCICGAPRCQRPGLNLQGKSLALVRDYLRRGLTEADVDRLHPLAE